MSIDLELAPSAISTTARQPMLRLNSQVDFTSLPVLRPWSSAIVQQA